MQRGFECFVRTESGLSVWANGGGEQSLLDGCFGHVKMSQGRWMKGKEGQGRWIKERVGDCIRSQFLQKSLKEVLIWREGMVGGRDGKWAIKDIH